MADAGCGGHFGLRDCLRGCTLARVEAVRNGQWAALAALGAVVVGVGSNLLANQLQNWKDERDVVRRLAEAVPDQPALRAEIERFSPTRCADRPREALPEPDRAWYVETLRAESGQQAERIVTAPGQAGKDRRNRDLRGSGGGWIESRACRSGGVSSEWRLLSC